MEIKLSQETFKALANPTRIAILKYLDKRRYTQSELADMFGFAVTTIKQHLDDLKKTGLVKVIDDGRKWKYIELTKEGKAILHPEEKKIWILLGTFVASVAGGVYAFSKKLITAPTHLITNNAAPVLEGEIAEKGALFATQDAVQRVSEEAVAVAPQMMKNVVPPAEFADHAAKASLDTFGGRGPEITNAISKTSSVPDVWFYIFLAIAIICVAGIVFYLIKRYKRLRWLKQVVKQYEAEKK